MKMDNSQVRALLFDMHHTITKKPGFDQYFTSIEILKSCGYDVSNVTKEKFDTAVERLDEWLLKYQIENDADIHWGENITDWIEPTRIMFEEIGIGHLTDEQIIEIEGMWKKENKRREILVEDAAETLAELRRRGYLLGLITKRYDNPTDALRNFGILDLFSVVEWSGTIGYAKPSPYQLIIAASKLGVNPIKCAYIGNFINTDVEAARRAGMVPILAVWGNPEEAAKADSDVIVINRLIELLEIF